MPKRLIIRLLLGCYLARCKFKFWLFGPYGVADMLKNAPYPFIQPILRIYGAHIGKNCVIDTGMIIHRPDKKIPFKNLAIGDNCYVGHNNLFDLSSKVVIENDVGLGAECQFWTHVGDYTECLTNRETDYHERVEMLVIRKKTVVYSGVIVSPGIEVGEYCRVGAGSVVTRSLGSHGFYAGIPAVRIKNI